MKKLFIFFAVVIIALVAFGIFSINSIVKTGVETVAPTVTGTSVTLGSANISVFSGSGSLSDLVVGNPSGYKGENAISMKNISVKIQPSSLLENTIIIDEILIDTPTINYEMNESGFNLNNILRTAQNASQQKAISQSSGEDSQVTKSTKKVIINNLKIRNAQVSLATSLLNSSAGATIPVPDIHITDIGKESGGASFEQASATVLKAVTKKLSTMKLDINSLNLDGTANEVKGVADKLKGLFGN